MRISVIVNSPLFITIITKSHHYCLPFGYAIRFTLNPISLRSILLGFSNLRMDSQKNDVITKSESTWAEALESRMLDLSATRCALCKTLS
jgi:hypothetical protein